jgi:hypothetical protein
MFWFYSETPAGITANQRSATSKAGSAAHLILHSNRKGALNTCNYRIQFNQSHWQGWPHTSALPQVRQGVPHTWSCVATSTVRCTLDAVATAYLRAGMTTHSASNTQGVQQLMIVSVLCKQGSPHTYTCLKWLVEFYLLNRSFTISIRILCMRSVLRSSWGLITWNPIKPPVLL